MRVIVEGSGRFLRLYDEIKDQLQNLESHLERLLAWDQLFGQHLILQKPLVNSYINVLRFWRRVEKECQRWGSSAEVCPVQPLMPNDTCACSVQSIGSRSSFVQYSKIERYGPGLRQRC